MQALAAGYILTDEWTFMNASVSKFLFTVVVPKKLGAKKIVVVHDDKITI